jgi:hypothetical protein
MNKPTTKKQIKEKQRVRTWWCLSNATKRTQTLMFSN